MTLPSAAALGLTSIVHESVVSSTMDVAHTLAQQGAPAGVLVIADQQDGGRGRGGHTWASQAGAGVWMTLIERPRDQRVVGVLALRLGMALAEALTPLARAPISLKWPNDVFAGTGKLAGILVEARWRDAQVDWVAIGIGINLRVPTDFPQAASVRADVSRNDVLSAVMPGVREAAQRRGVLTPTECLTWQARDLAFGRRLSQPAVGIAAGIEPDGALRVRADDGEMSTIHAGSLVFAD